MWRGTSNMTSPIEVACPDGLHPNKDADGISIYENTHFKTEREAWQNIEDNVTAGVSLAGSEVKRAEEMMRLAEKNAADAVKAYDNWRSAQLLRYIDIDEDAIRDFQEST